MNRLFEDPRIHAELTERPVPVAAPPPEPPLAVEVQTPAPRRGVPGWTVFVLLLLASVFTLNTVYHLQAEQTVTSRISGRPPVAPAPAVEILPPPKPAPVADPPVMALPAKAETVVARRPPQFVVEEEPVPAEPEPEPPTKSVFHLERVAEVARQAREKRQPIIWWVGMSPADGPELGAFFRSAEKFCHVFTQKASEAAEHGERLLFSSADGRQFFVKRGSVNAGTLAKIERLQQPDREAPPDAGALGPGLEGKPIGGQNFLELLNREIRYVGPDGRKVTQTLGEFLAGGGDCTDEELRKAGAWDRDAVELLRDYQRKVTGGKRGSAVGDGSRRIGDGSKGVRGSRPEPEAYVPPPRTYQGWEFGLGRPMPWWSDPGCVGRL